jgi:hypothetical protein
MSLNKNNIPNTKAVSTRAYSGQRDLQAVLDLVKERSLDQRDDFPGIIDLQEMLAIPKIQAHTRLWIDPDSQLAYFAILDGDHSSASLIHEVGPAWKDNGLEDMVIDWAETSIRQTCPAHTGLFLQEASSRSDNSECITLLERLGVEPQPGSEVHMERSLADPIAEPQLPPRFIIRPIRGEAKAEA